MAILALRYARGSKAALVGRKLPALRFTSRTTCRYAGDRTRRARVRPTRLEDSPGVELPRRLRRRSGSARPSNGKLRFGEPYPAFGFRAPGEIRTPDPQVRR